MAVRRRYEPVPYESQDPLIAKFADHLRMRRTSPQTSVAYQRDLENFGSFLKASDAGENPDAHQEAPYGRLEAASQTDVLAYQRRLTSSRAYSPRSIRRKLSALRTFYKFLRFDRIREDNPAAEVPAPKIGKQLPKALSRSQVTKLLELRLGGLSEARHARDRAILELMYSSGLRRSEVLGLEWGDVDLDRLSVRIIAGKGNKDRVVPITHAAGQALRAYQAVRPRSPMPRVFVGRAGAALSESALYKIVRTYMRVSGIEENAHPHTLRHTAATHLYEGGADLLFLKEFLGHESLATVEIYTKVSSDRIRSQFEAAHPRDHLDVTAQSPPRRKPKAP